MPESVLIQYDKCRMTLSLPAFFDGSSLTNIRKVFKLLSERPTKMHPHLKRLTAFSLRGNCISKRRSNLKKREKKKTIEQTARAAESKVACFGTMATKEMKAELLFAQRELKKAALEVKRAKSAFERCGKIKNAYNEFLR